MPSSTLIKVVGVAGACACVGAGAGILGSAGAATPPAKTTAAAATPRLARPLRRALHIDAIVPAGNGRFASATFDRGVLKAVNGSDLTIAEGTAKATYKTVTLTIPADAKVRDNGQPAQLSALRPGQRVSVFHGPRQTRVGAHDARTP
jgi:hypothetical protein